MNKHKKMQVENDILKEYCEKTESHFVIAISLNKKGEKQYFVHPYQWTFGNKQVSDCNELTEEIRELLKKRYGE